MEDLLVDDDSAAAKPYWDGREFFAEASEIHENREELDASGNDTSMLLNPPSRGDGKRTLLR